MPPSTSDSPSNAWLRWALEHAAEGLAVFGADQRLLGCNAAFTTVNRLQPGVPTPGLSLDGLLTCLASTGELGNGDASGLAQAAASEIFSAPVWRRVRADGNVVETRRSATPDAGFALSCTLITERQPPAGAHGKDPQVLALLFGLTEEGIWFIDNQLRTTDANPAMCRMLGRSFEDMVGSSIYDHVDDDNAAVFRHHTALRSGGLATGYEVTLRHADGSAVHCYNNATPIFDASGQKIGAVGLCSDISPLKHAEQRLRQTGDLLAQKSHVLEVTLDSLLQGVLSVDTHGRINAWNRRFLDLLQIPQTFMQARPTLQALMQYQIDNGHFGNDVESAVQAAVDGQRVAEGADLSALRPGYRRTRPDGVVLDVQTHAAADGSAIRTYTDVTASVHAQRALQESETRFRRIADGAPALIWQSAADGTALWFNQRWRDYTGLTNGEALMRGWAARVHPQDVERCRTLFEQALAERAPFDAEYRLLCADGSHAWIADNGIPRFGADGRFEGHIGYGWDITARKAARAELIAAKDEAERANRAKSEFLSRMSHELRTPLNAVLGFGQLLESDRDDPLRDAQRARVQELLRGGRHLLSLINDVLDLARIEAGTLKLQLTEVSLADTVGDCLRLVAPMAVQRDIGLACQANADNDRVMADPVRLKQVLLNLLSNAIKYSPAGGSVNVAWRADGAALRLDVEDSGPGLAAAQQDRLFQAFERLDADASGVEGAGIGLALSKWLVDLMHGEIGVRSVPGQGSTFWVRLGRSDGTPAQAGSSALRQPPALPRLHGRTALYIEDNAVNQILMEGMLAQRPGLRLHLASLPETGLAMARQLRPDLVLLDIQLPGIDGYEVLRRLRADPATRAIPVVAVSANALPSDLDPAASAGFADYVTKPLDLQRLLAVVDRLLGPAPAV